MKQGNRTQRIMIYLTGFLFLTFGQRSFVYAGFGAGTFDALCVGLAGKSVISPGNWVTICSCIMMGISAFLEKRKPDMKVLISSFIFGVFFDFWGIVFIKLMPNPALLTRLIIFCAGMILAPFGTAVYFITGFSKSAFDEFIMSIVHCFGLSVRNGKTLCEIGMMLLAFLARGPIGVTTILVAFLFGPFLQHYIHYFEHHQIRILMWWK